MDVRSPQLTQRDAPRRGADHIAPDCAGQNFYACDRGLRDLLPLYLSSQDFARLGPHFDRLGQLAGGRLDELARIADTGFAGLAFGLFDFAGELPYFCAEVLPRLERLGVRVQAGRHPSPPAGLR